MARGCIGVRSIRTATVRGRPRGTRRWPVSTACKKANRQCGGWSTLPTSGLRSLGSMPGTCCSLLSEGCSKEQPKLGREREFLRPSVRLPRPGPATLPSKRELPFEKSNPSLGGRELVARYPCKTTGEAYTPDSPSQSHQMHSRFGRNLKIESHSASRGIRVIFTYQCGDRAMCDRKMLVFQVFPLGNGPLPKGGALPSRSLLHRRPLQSIRYGWMRSFRIPARSQSFSDLRLKLFHRNDHRRSDALDFHHGKGFGLVA